MCTCVCAPARGRPALCACPHYPFPGPGLQRSPAEARRRQIAGRAGVRRGAHGPMAARRVRSGISWQRRRGGGLCGRVPPAAGVRATSPSGLQCDKPAAGTREGRLSVCQWRRAIVPAAGIPRAPAVEGSWGQTDREQTGREDCLAAAVGGGPANGRWLVLRGRTSGNGGESGAGSSSGSVRAIN